MKIKAKSIELLAGAAIPYSLIEEIRMANSYDATGLLVLDRITPVITALFGAFILDAEDPGDGEAYIAKTSRDNNPTWMDVRQGLLVLASSSGVVASGKRATDDAIIKELLARHGCHEFPALFDDGEYESVGYNPVEPTDGTSSGLPAPASC